MAQTYETHPIVTNWKKLYPLLQAGYKKCTGCNHFIKWEGARCPICKRQLKTRLHKKGKLAIREMLKSLVPEQPRTCTRCGSTTTYMHPRAYGSVSAEWRNIDGKWHCLPCVWKLRYLKKP